MPLLSLWVTIFLHTLIPTQFRNAQKTLHCVKHVYTRRKHLISYVTTVIYHTAVEEYPWFQAWLFSYSQWINTEAYSISCKCFLVLMFAAFGWKRAIEFEIFICFVVISPLARDTVSVITVPHRKSSYKKEIHCTRF